MSNCGNPYSDGGTISNTTIVSPTIQGGSANGLHLSGSVPLDQLAIQSIVTQICDALKPCIKKHVDGGTFENVTLHDGTIEGGSLKGNFVLDNAAANTIATNIYSEMQTLLTPWVTGLISAVTTTTIGAVASNGGTLMSGSVIDTEIRGGRVDGVRGKDNIFETSTLRQPVFQGNLTMDAAAVDSLCVMLSNCIKHYADISADDAVSRITNALIASVFNSCDGDPLSPGTKLVTCGDFDRKISSTISIVESKLSALDIISSLSYDDKTKVLTLHTTMGNGTKQDFTVDFNDLAAGVVTDNNTIIGDGTQDGPLAVKWSFTNLPISSLENRLPLTLIGSRDSLLGLPAQFIRIFGYAIPAYRLNEG